MSLCTEVEGLGGKGRSRSSVPLPPGRLPPACSERRNRGTSRSRLCLFRACPPVRQVRHGHTPGGRRRYSVGRPGGRFVGGGCGIGIPIENRVAWRPWRRGPGRPRPSALCAARCALCDVACRALCAVLCACRCCALCVVHCRAQCAAVCAVRCVLHFVVHCVLYPAVHCVPCSVLAMHAHCYSAVRCALRTVLLVHPGAVPYVPFRVPLHPPLPDLPALPALWGGGGGGYKVAMGVGSRAPLNKPRIRNAAKDLL